MDQCTGEVFVDELGGCGGPPAGVPCPSAPPSRRAKRGGRKRGCVSVSVSVSVRGMRWGRRPGGVCDTLGSERSSGGARWCAQPARGLCQVRGRFDSVLMAPW